MSRKNVKVALIGLGPHGQWTYLPALLKAQCQPTLIVELSTNKSAVLAGMKKYGFTAATYFIDPVNRDSVSLSDADEFNLRDIVKRLDISHAIITTEPKAHMSYARFFVDNNVNVLMDKPISSPIGASLDPLAAQQIFHDWQELVELTEDRPDVNIYVMAQRRYDLGYVKARSIVQEVIGEHEIPLSFVEVFHGSGTWNLPSEFKSREGHPYKYGYGKLLHSGFHFVDLFAWMSECNSVIPSKRPDNIQIFHNRFMPRDAVFQVGIKGYERFFGVDEAQKLFEGVTDEMLTGCGELDSYSLIQLKRGGHVVTTGSLNMLDNSFSRRSWAKLPLDTYKGNGRTRHIRMNLQVGPLLNVQIHSYESQKQNEISDDPLKPVDPGGWDHFDIYVFRNTSLIGGDKVEIIRGEDIGRRSGAAFDEYYGQNREARETCVKDFIFGDPVDLRIESFEHTHRLLSLLHECAARDVAGELPLVRRKW